MAVGNAFYRHALLAQGAVVFAVNPVIRQIVLRKDRVDLYAGNVSRCAERGGDADCGAAVVLHAFDRALNGFSARDAGDQNQHFFAVNHSFQIVSEDHVAGGVIFRP